MKEILKENKKFTMECDHCDSTFTYELNDTRFDHSAQATYIECPACGHSCYHKNRLIERESLYNVTVEDLMNRIKTRDTKITNLEFECDNLMEMVKLYQKLLDVTVYANGTSAVRLNDPDAIGRILIADPKVTNILREAWLMYGDMDTKFNTYTYDEKDDGCLCEK